MWMVDGIKRSSQFIFYFLWCHVLAFPSASAHGRGNIWLQRSLLELPTIHWMDHWFSQSQRRPLLRAFSWLKAPTRAFIFKTLLRHYAKHALTLFVIMKTNCETDGSSPALVVAGAEAGAQAELWAGPQAELPAEAGHGAGHPVQPGDDQWS